MKPSISTLSTISTVSTASVWAATGAPRKVMATLATGVVVAHVVVLQWAGTAMDVPMKLITRPLVARAMVIDPPEAIAAPAAVKVAVPVPAPSPVTPRPRKPQPVAPSAVRPVTESVGTAGPLEPAQTATENVAVSAPETVVAAAPQPPASAAAAPAAPVPPLPVVAQDAPPPPPAPVAIAYTVPGSVRLLYKTVAKINQQNWDINGELLWQHDGSQYDARLQWSLFLVGAKTLTSKGRVGSDGLLPTRYSDKFRSSEVAAHFERDKQKVVFSANTPEVPLLAGMQDQLSVFVQMGAMLAGAPGKYPAGTKLTFETIGARAPDTWVFVVDGEEALSLPGGDQIAVKLTRLARREFDQTAELWLSPQLGYLPVRIKISERNGDFVDQQWRATETP